MRAPSHKAISKIERQIKERPRVAMLHLRHGIALGALQHFDEACRAFEKAIAYLPDYSDAWACLGEAELARSNLIAARQAFAQAYLIDPSTAGVAEGLRKLGGFGFRTGLKLRDWIRFFLFMRSRANADAIDRARMLLKDGEIAEALCYLRRTFGSSPRGPDACLAFGVAHSRHGNHHQARKFFERTARLRPSDSVAQFNLGAHLVFCGETERGIATLQLAKRLDRSKQTDAAFLLWTLKQGEMPTTSSAISVQSLFNSYAPDFDEHLVDRLDYRIPELIGDWLRRESRAWRRMIDLGCGTGLCGIQMRPHGEFLVGVDLAKGMIKLARDRECYDILELEDCVNFLQSNQEPFDLIVAADMLIYVGNLEMLFGAVKQRLHPAGIFLFSVELTGGDSYTLTPQRRFQHSLRYIKSAAGAAGLRVKSQEHVHIRMEAEVPVPGLLVALQHAQ